MAKVAPLSSGSHGMGTGPVNGAKMVKAKTPSELRREQLKRANVVDLTDEPPAPLSGFTNEVDNGFKRPGLLDVYPAKKPRFKLLSGKENAKENPSVEQTSNLKNVSVFSDLSAKKQQVISCTENSAVPNEVGKDGVLQACQTKEKCSQGKFFTVTELSSTAVRSSGLAAIDMDKALRGLATIEPRVSPDLATDSSGKVDSTFTVTDNFLSECHVPGQNAPLDLTLKTSMRVVSSSSMNWIHRSVVQGNASQFTRQHSLFKGQNMGGLSQLSSPSQDLRFLHSWMYPQSILPPSLISMLSSSTMEGELEFLSRRQADWEESFRDLYYMLRNNACAIFYVDMLFAHMQNKDVSLIDATWQWYCLRHQMCTSHFVVMFTGGNGSERSKCSCNAYISQSTRGLRSLLREHDLSFSMPLCHSKVEQVNTEDLVELSEIEKQNLGQTRRLRSFSDVDNSPESLLVFSGRKDVHGLYDVLLNYRSLLTLLSGSDVPVLCSPVPFQNAALSFPNIKCMEMRRVEHIAASSNRSIKKDGDTLQGPSDGLICSIEIKDTFLPPWIVCGVCTFMGSEGRSFEASFATEPTTIGLNVAFKPSCVESDSKVGASESSQKCSDTFGIQGATITSGLWSYSLRGLKYSDGSYTASLSPS